MPHPHAGARHGRWAPRGRSWWIGVLFAVGSLCFLVAPFPQFVRVIMVGNGQVAFAENVPDAIEQVLGAALPPPPDGGGGQPEDIASLVAEAQRLYDEAQAALAAGDLGAYQDRLNELAPVLEQLAELTGASPEPSPTAAP